MTQPSHSLPASPLADSIEHVVRVVGRTFAWSYLVLVAVIILQVVLRKVFHNGQIALEELQWHLYAIGVLFGLSYAEITGTHVRVDISITAFRKKPKRGLKSSLCCFSSGRLCTSFLSTRLISFMKRGG